MQIITKSGFACEINEKIFADWRFVRLLRRVEDDSVPEEEKLFSVVDLSTLILGQKQEDALVEHLLAQSEDGTVSVFAMYAELKSIMNAIGDSKKNT